MSTEAWENRFRDPIYVVIWQRWQNARSRWRKSLETTPFLEGGPDVVFNPDPLLITNPENRKAAQEFIDARVAYHAENRRKVRNDEQSAVLVGEIGKDTQETA